MAVCNNHLDVIKWLWDNGIKCTVHEANTAAYYGHIDVLQWLSEHDIYPNGNNVCLESLKWLYDNGIMPVSGRNSYASLLYSTNDCISKLRLLDWAWSELRSFVDKTYVKPISNTFTFESGKLYDR